MRYDSHYLPCQWTMDNFEMQLDEPGHESLNVNIVAIYIVLALALTQYELWIKVSFNVKT